MKSFKFTKKKGCYGGTIISFNTDLFNGLHIGTKCDLVVVILKQLKKYHPNPLLNSDLGAWAAYHIEEYNKNKLAQKTLLEIHYHRAIIEYLSMGGLSIIGDWEEIVEMLEFYWNNIKK